MQLSKVEKVDLRQVWTHEALHFTNWLAEPENLAMLSDEIGIELSLLQTEASVGNFNVDILAEEPNTGRKVVIENQLEATDHDHLGKIITYASGLDAEILIWIVKSVRDEHKQAVQWLNENTDAKINIFAIQMEVWKIADSPCAPMFHVIAQPNDWAKAVKKSTNNAQLSETKLMQLEFWTQFREFSQEQNPNIKLQKPNAQHWYNISAGSSNAHIVLTANTQADLLTCEFYIPSCKSLFHHLEASKEIIEEKLELKLEWEELPSKKASRIKIARSGSIADESLWPSYFEWYVDKVVKYQQVFPSYYASLSQNDL